MNRLFDPKNLVVSTYLDRGMFKSILNVIQGEIYPPEIQSALGAAKSGRVSFTRSVKAITTPPKRTF
jgi:hypothetical protein